MNVHPVITTRQTRRCSHDLYGLGYKFKNVKNRKTLFSRENCIDNKHTEVGEINKIAEN
jgi:hypothetical protein